MNEIFWKSRWSPDQIRALLIEQFETFWRKDTGIERTKLSQIKQSLASPHAVIISGLRRVGKSTLLAQLAHHIGQDQFYYINFEEDRFLGFRAEDANDLFRALVEVFGERKIFIIDEIQNVPGWEHFIRRFIDMGYKFFITGSNASLLSRELGTRLTGRYLPIELFPFSFREYLQFRGEAIPDFTRLTTIDLARLNSALNTYLTAGGIPDALKYPELPLLRTLYDDVLYRDIATRYHLEAVTALKALAFSLISNPASPVSYNKLKEQLRLGSVNTITSYMEYLKNSWLLFAINRYAYSVKQQQIAPKKVYCIDNGIVNTLGFHFSPNTGKLTENLVFLALRQNHPDLYYLPTPAGYEVDFYLPEQRQLIQVCQQLENQATREREIRAIVDAAREVPVERALILSAGDEPDEVIEGVTVHIQSLSRWLVEQQV